MASQALIAIIDDDPVVLHTTKQLLSYLFPGVYIDIYRNPDDFINHIQQDNEELPELIFCDYNMPQMSGLEVHNALIPFSKNNSKAIEFYLMSSNSDLESIAKEFTSDFFSGYYAKPLDYNKLSQILNQTQINLAS